MTFSPASITRFRALGYELDADAGTLTCRYALDDELRFTEVIRAEPGPAWHHPAVAEAARLVFLLAGVSYYKAAAPPLIDLGMAPVRPGEREALRGFFLHGLGEYAYRNALDLGAIAVVGGDETSRPPAPWPARDAAGGDAAAPLVPFGGGVDSIVTIDAVAGRYPDAALFVLSRHGTRFAAIEDAAAVTGLPVLRADQQLDPQIRRSRELGFRNGHVPVTGVLSAIAVLVAALHGRGQVVLSNEHSASAGNLTAWGREINHQWSKSMAFERGFRQVLDGAFTAPPAYYSYLRSASELAVARRFAELTAFHPVFRSCNRAFHVDPAARLDRWCGTCDKCAFIDLVLAPELSPAALRAVFDGPEPLDRPELAATFRSLIGTSADAKPFECVGDIDESRAAAVLAADRPDRRGQPLLQQLVAELGAHTEVAGIRAAAPTLLTPQGDDHLPAGLPHVADRIGTPPTWPADG